MGYVGFKTNPKEEKELEELETLLRSIDPLHKIGSRSAAVKESVRIALFHIKNSYFYGRGLTKDLKLKSCVSQKPPSKQIMSSEIDIYGKRR